MAGGKLLVYLLRRDLRVSDNPIFHHLATSKDHGFTHLLPVFIFPSKQVEVSGFLKDGQESPYPPAVSQVGKFWRTGPHRAKFLAQSVWDIKKTLDSLDSGLLLRVGSPSDVVQHLLPSLKEQQMEVGGVWMTEEKSYEEEQDQTSVAAVCKDHGVDFKLWLDEKYFIDDRDTGLENPSDLPDVFTSYRKSQEPLRERPRPALPKPEKGSLPTFPGAGSIPHQQGPFVEAQGLDDLEKRLLAPLTNVIPNPPPFPEGAVSAHPFSGGETNALDRLHHLIKSGAMSAYKETRNGLIGPEFSTKLSAYLALGCITARQIHQDLAEFEDGKNSVYESVKGYGKGENEGTRGVRFELLWRDYMRLCTRKFGQKLFRLTGFRDEQYAKEWKTADPSAAQRDQSPAAGEVQKIIDRFLDGTTGMGLIDASQRELFHTGYTSNRARQNVASFLAKHVGIDWRYGAEWYEMLLIDYDVSSNWSNWQYVAGIGNDPRGDARIFNPIKQAFDYDREGSYVRTWVPEVKGLNKLENVFQACTANHSDLQKCGISDHIMVTNPIKRIEFTVDKKPKATRARRRGGGRGGRRGEGGGGGHYNGPNGGQFGPGGQYGQDGNPNGGSASPHSGSDGQGHGHGQRRPPKGPSGYQQHGNNHQLHMNGQQQFMNGHQHFMNGHQQQGNGYQHANGYQHHYRNYQPQQRANSHQQPYPSYKGGPQNHTYDRQGYPHPAQGYYNRFGDAQWFNDGWTPMNNGGGGYGNGNYRGRGGRRGNGGYGNRGGYGGNRHQDYNAPPSYYVPVQNTGPA